MFRLGQLLLALLARQRGAVQAPSRWTPVLELIAVALAIVVSAAWVSRAAGWVG